jgi:hypothetical protein
LVDYANGENYYKEGGLGAGGIGVPASEAEHIFEEFVQLDEYRYFLHSWCPICDASAFQFLKLAPTISLQPI